MSEAMVSRASSTPLTASRPKECWEFALPNMSEKYGAIFERTAASSPVVAA